MAKQIKSLQTPDLAQVLTAELLGKAIKARRTQSHLRLEDAAMPCGVAKQTLMNIEHGHASSKLATILQICQGLGITLSITPWSSAEEVEDEWY